MQKDSGNSENEKMDLCGQSPLVDSKTISKVKKTADFMRNQPFLLGVMALMDTICDGDTVVAREVCNHTLDFVTEGLWL